MAKGRHDEPCVVDDEDRISSWLRDAALNEDGEDADELSKAMTIGPTTPPRRPLLQEYYDEVSPTNTTFSNNSTFDTPHSAVDGWIEDIFGDDVPDKVPIDDRTCCPNEERSLKRPHTNVDIDHFDTESRVSYDPPSEVTADLEEETSLAETSTAIAISHVEPEKPRPTWLTSCTQCIHADLPCSRKAPACSRCRRKGQAALCLLHRRPYPEEILRSDASWSSTLILLRLKDEDEGIWKEKLRLNDKVSSRAARRSVTDKEKLQETWRSEVDHKNWVLPSVDSPRGDFRSNRTRVMKAYPGEGIGERKDRFSYQELCVVMND